MLQSDKDLIIATGQALFGEHWQTPLSQALGLSNPRRLRDWLSGNSAMPHGVWSDLRALVARQKVVIDSVLARYPSPSEHN